MAGKPRSNKPATPYEKRRLGIERRLQAALERLVSGAPKHPSLQGQVYRLSVSTLAREARVSRNTIYANHRSILEQLNSDHSVSARIRPTPKQKIAELRAMIEQMQLQKRQLATENATLLKRAIDAETMLDRLRNQNARLLRERAARQPVVLLAGNSDLIPSDPDDAILS
jgi:AcrR family transcriptional regulator